MTIESKIVETIKGIVKKDKNNGFIRLKIPRHLAVVTKGKTLWAEKHNKPLTERGIKVSNSNSRLAEYAVVVIACTKGLPKFDGKRF